MKFEDNGRALLQQVEKKLEALNDVLESSPIQIHAGCDGLSLLPHRISMCYNYNIWNAAPQHLITSDNQHHQL